MSARVNKSREDIFVSAAAGIFIGAVLVEIAPDAIKDLSFYPAILLLVGGFAVWHLLKLLTNAMRKNGLAVVSAGAFVFHSFLEGAVTALSFSVSRFTGLIVAFGMLLHLFPEFFALVGVMRGEGVSLRKSVLVDLAGVMTLVISFLVIYALLPNFSRLALNSLEAVSGGAFVYIGVMSFKKRATTAVNYIALAAGLLLIGLWRTLLH